MKIGDYFSKFFLYVILSVFALIFLYPFIWMLYTALKSDSEILGNPLQLPKIKYYFVEKEKKFFDPQGKQLKDNKELLKKGETFYTKSGKKVKVKIYKTYTECIPYKKIRLLNDNSVRYINEENIQGFKDGKKHLYIYKDGLVPYKKVRSVETGGIELLSPDDIIEEDGKFYTGFKKKEIEILKFSETEIIFLTSNRNRNPKESVEVKILKLSKTEVIPVKKIIKSGRKWKSRIVLTSLNKLTKRRFLFENFKRAWVQGKYFNYYLFNSVFTSSISTLLQMILAAMAAFAFARLIFKGKELIFTLFLATMMIPSQMLLIPNYLIISKMGFYNTYFGIILPWLANVTNIFLLRQFFKSIPNDLFDSIRIDGGNIWMGFIHIALPLSKPILVTTALFSFIFQWNSFIWVLIITNDPKMQTLQVGLSNFSQSFGTDWNLLMAASTIVILPLIILYFFVQRRIIESLATTGLKG